MTLYVFSGSQTFTSRAYNLLPGDELDVLTGAVMTGQINQTYDTSALIKGVGARVVNSGTITNIWTVLELSGGSTLINHGSLRSTYSLAATTVQFLADATNATNAIVNDGTISSSGGGFAAVSAAAPLSVINAAGGLIVGISANFLYLENYGTITGASTGTPSSGVGTAVGSSDGYVLNGGTMHRVSVGAGTLDNQGNLTGAATAHVLNNSGTIQSSGAFEYRSVNGTAASDTVVNSGMLRGDLSLGDGADTVDNRHGTIDGGVNLGAGDDRFDSTGGTILHTSQSPYGNPAIVGGAGNDIITGAAGNDLIYGDNISGDTSGGADTLSGGGGDDILFAGYGNDTVLGNQGNDVLSGNQGDDWIHGGQGNDQIWGGQGNDTINGGVGNDTLYGNLGNDTFVFSPHFGYDTIADFSTTPGNYDVIRFEPGTFATFREVQDHMLQQSDGTYSLVTISLETGSYITLLGTTAASLTADHFLFG